MNKPASIRKSIKILKTNTHLSWVLLSLFALLQACAAGPQYTLMTYNIRHGVGMDRVHDLQRTAGVMASVSPDFVILNEVDQATVRSGGMHEADTLGKLLGLRNYFSASIEYDGGSYGNAFLSRYPILSFDVHDISANRYFEGRSLFHARILLEADTLHVWGTHLGLDSLEREEQVNDILGLIEPSQAMILGGDFNLEPGSHPYNRIAEILVDGVAGLNTNPGNTYPADIPIRRIDFLFLGHKVEATSIPSITAENLKTASDHLPQILTFIVK